MKRFLGIAVSAALFCIMISIRPCPAGEYPKVALKIKSVPTDWSITLTWTVPEKMQPHRLMLVRKENDFPESTQDGQRVATGPGPTAVDKNLVADTNYYYRFFLFDSSGNIMGWARHKEKT
jgi:hypothetical protein